MTGFTDSDKRFMKKAIELAEKGRGRTAPNPMVGAVIARDGKAISEGYHKEAGKDHAEIAAIKNSNGSVKNSTIYISLEPCTIAGKTPPCADELIKRGFKKVVIGAADPNPEVMGKGIERLKGAGIEIASGLYEKEIQKQNEIFFKNMQKGLPFVCAKIATSIDGKLAASASDFKWITGPISRKAVQRLRFEYGCVLTGINTIISDNPTLFPKAFLEDTEEKNITAFLTSEESTSFTRVILDTDLRLPQYSAITKTADRIRTVIFASTGEKEEIPANRHLIIEYSSTGRWEPKKILKVLYQKYSITSVMLESGPTVLTSFLTTGLIDKYKIFIAPMIIGGNSIYGMFGDIGAKTIKEGLGLRFDSFEVSGEDILITAYPSGGKD